MGSRRFLPLVLLVLLLAQMQGSTSVALADATGREYLSGRGLIERNDKWLLPLELEVQQRVQKLPKLETNLIQAENYQQRLAQNLFTTNARLQLGIQTAETNLRILQAGREELRAEGRKRLVDARIKSEQEKLDALRNAWVEPEHIAGLPMMKEAVILLTNHRNELALTILFIHDARPSLREQYAELKKDVHVGAALKQLGNDQQLGSGIDYDSKAFLTKLAGYEKLVFTDEVPLYRAAEDFRVAGLINRTPVTFTWHVSEGPTMLTASVLESVGLQVPRDAPKKVWRFPDGNELAVREIKIPYLRFGRHVLKDVSAFVLPPEGERYGTQIGPVAFEGQSPEADAKRMRLVIQ